MQTILTSIAEKQVSYVDRLQMWSDFIEQANVSVMAELGVWKGEFAEQILLNCESIQQYIMVDPWANLTNWNKPFNIADELFTDVYQEAMNRVAFAKHKVTVLRDCTNRVVKQIADDALDFVYIDGDHTLRGITLDLLSIYDKVKPGGVIAGDDFTHTPWQHDVKYEPTLVCPFSIYFAEAMNIPIIAMGKNQYAMIKDPSAGFSFEDSTGEYGDLALNKLAAKV